MVAPTGRQPEDTRRAGKPSTHRPARTGAQRGLHPRSCAPTGRSPSRQPAGSSGPSRPSSSLAARGRELACRPGKPPSHRPARTGAPCCLHPRSCARTGRSPSQQPAGSPGPSRSSSSSQQPARMVAPSGQQPTSHAGNREVVHAAAGQGGRAWRPAAEDRRADRKVTLAAAGQDGRAHRPASEVTRWTGKSSTLRPARTGAPCGLPPRGCAQTGRSPSQQPAGSSGPSRSPSSSRAPPDVTLRGSPGTSSSLLPPASDSTDHAGSTPGTRRGHPDSRMTLRGSPV